MVKDGMYLLNWPDKMNWHFACWCRFRKARSYFHDFWVGIVRNGCGHIVYETPKPCVSAVCWVVFLELDHQVSLNFSMVLENLIKLYMSDFQEEHFLPLRNWGNGSKNRPKILFVVFQYKSSIWEKCSWDIFQNSLRHLHCRIFKSSIPPEQIDEAASFCTCWYKFTKIKRWLESFWWDMIKNDCGKCGLWTLELTVSQ